MANTATSEASPSFLERLFFAWAYFFRLLADPRLCARTKQLADGREPTPEAPAAEKALPAKIEPPATPAEVAKAEAKIEAAPAIIAPAIIAPAIIAPPSNDPALALLGVLQKEGRLVDFLEQDIATFSDSDVGAAARVVHEGCRKAIKGILKFEVVRSEEEGARISVAEGDLKSNVKVTGQVSGSPPFAGALRHRGWRVTDLKLPTFTAGMDAYVIAPAEVEL